MKATARKFLGEARRLSADLRHRGLIRKALGGYYVARDKVVGRYLDWQGARVAAASVKWSAIHGLDRHLEEFQRNIEGRGGRVHWARDGAEAREIILGIARARGARRVVKSKCMTSEEIHLNEALAQAGCEVVETDLGEFIVQLRREPPYHFVFPAMHLTRGEVSDVFQRELGSEPSESPEELTAIARETMRRRYCEADMGITGANFAIAETGMISITENEGNARLTLGLPRTHVVLMGIEKVLPRLSDLALFLPMLATAGAGQTLTGYNSMIGGPRRPGEIDGPEEFHVVLLDNHRTRLLADPEQRDALHCIRCGACLNVCPVFKSIGGHSYGTTYQGPIGSVITPHFRGLRDWKHLSAASSLCGACSDACPVGIDIHHHLLRNRRNAMRERPTWWEKAAFAAVAFVMNRPALYRAALRVARLMQPLHRFVDGGPLDPARVWTRTRRLPAIAPRMFQEMWRERGRR